MKKWLAKLSLTALTLPIVAMTAPSLVQAEVMIAPTRVVMENGKRSAELVIVNKGDEQAAFRVSLENRRMNIDGSMMTVDTPQDGELFAIDHIRYSPRRVLLEPGGRQTVRVSLTNTNLEPGEYRSHLRLQAAPTSAGRTLQSATSTGGEDISIQLVAIRSLTIPVIARVGDLDAQVSLDGATMKSITHNEGDTVLEARLTRTGNKSVYGHVEIYAEGIEKPIFFARGIAIYTPNTERIVKLPLPQDVQSQLSGRDIKIVYRSSDPQNPKVLGELKARIN